MNKTLFDEYTEWALFEFINYINYFEDDLNADEIESMMFGVWWCDVRKESSND